MDVIEFDTLKTYGAFKPMNAVNNGPIHKRHANDQKRGNLAAFTAARIPFVRNHDASFENDYGSEHTVDISAIFPDFDADPYDPRSYDFACTDEYIQVTNLTGAETFYRLGQRIEHYVRKYGTLPPEDFQRWAIVCEHVIRHYNEGWANGFRFNMRYWEIWNEPDLDGDDSPNKRTWGGTRAQFFDLFETVAKHLKRCFPTLRIGGPALAHDLEWAADFLAEMRRREVPLDFFSWHIYTSEPEAVIRRADAVRALLVQSGYEKTESILNEWNYIEDWEEGFVRSIEVITGAQGAAFSMACMSLGQRSSVDMLMYYDARPCIFNGLFDFYTLRPLRGYYPFLWYGMMYGRKEIRARAEPEDLYTLCGIDSAGKTLTVLTHYNRDGMTPARTVRLDLGREATYEVLTLDADHDGTEAYETEELTFTLPAGCCLLIREK